MLLETLNTTHDEYDGERLCRLRALYEGGPAWHAEAPRAWFPERFAEPSEVYEERKKLLTYTNHAGSLIEMLAALLFAEAPQVEGVPTPKPGQAPSRTEAYWAALLDNCDRQGTPWGEFWRDRLIAAQVGRRSYAWVNLPARGSEGPDNRGDEEHRGLLDAYLVGLDPEQVIDWGRDPFGRLEWVMVRGVSTQRASIESPRRKVWTWTYIDGTVIRRWRWQQTEDHDEPRAGEDIPEYGEPIVHNIGRIPVVELCLPAGLHTMGKLEDPAVAATRARNEHSWALHQAANELLTITARWGDAVEPPVLGHGHFLKLTRDTDGEDRAAYVGPSGVAFTHLEKDVEATREELYRVVQQMAMAADSDASRVRSSGESKAQDWKALDIILGAYRGHVLRGMAETLDLIALARGEKLADDFKVSGLDGWQTEDLTTWLAAVALAPDAIRMSPTLRREIGKRQAERLLQGEVADDVLNAIRTEIDEAPEEMDPIYGPATRLPRGTRPPQGG